MTETAETTLDLPHMEIRQAVSLWDVKTEKINEQEEAELAPLRDEAMRLEREIRQKYEKEKEAALEVYRARLKALEADCEAEQQRVVGPIDAQRAAIIARYAAQMTEADAALPEDTEDHVDLDSITRCAKTGFVILNEDETVEDYETGEVFLRAALGLPPRASDEDDSADEAA